MYLLTALYSAHFAFRRQPLLSGASMGGGPYVDWTWRGSTVCCMPDLLLRHFYACWACLDSFVSLNCSFSLVLCFTKNYHTSLIFSRLSLFFAAFPFLSPLFSDFFSFSLFSLFAGALPPLSPSPSSSPLHHLVNRTAGSAGQVLEVQEHGDCVA